MVNTQSTPRVIALGFFDGVHLGHGGLLKRTKEIAAQLGVAASALTFDLHPDFMVSGAPVPLINSKGDRDGLMRRLYHIDEVLFDHFDEKFMHTPWQQFIEERLVAQLGAVHLVAGHDFRFGYRGEGTAERLMEKCKELNIGCDIIPKIEFDGITVSSTYIRELVADGKMQRANEFLGHPHCLTGEVIPGRKLGTAIGIPTANLQIPEGVLIPAYGVYASRVITKEGSYIAVTNVGVRPTVEQAGGVTVEPYILDFSGDLYGQTIRIEFYRFLRGERKFDSLGELIEEIKRNAETTRQFFEAGRLPD